MVESREPPTVRRLVPAGRARTEIEVLRSRFIATAGPASTVEEARNFVLDIRKEFPNATHHVPAYLIGHGAAVVAHCHDDGEPSGTAGRPALAVLRGSGLGDVVVVVTRFFGGTKLGTGGLARAYSDAVRSVLGALPLAEKAATHTVRIVVPYMYWSRARQAIASFRGLVVSEEFGAEAIAKVQLRVGDWPALWANLCDLSRGSVAAEIVETNPNTIFPLADLDRPRP